MCIKEHQSPHLFAKDLDLVPTLHHLGYMQRAPDGANKCYKGYKGEERDLYRLSQIAKAGSDPHSGATFPKMLFKAMARKVAGGRGIMTKHLRFVNGDQGCEAFICLGSQKGKCFW